jgi:hypothetical protein
MSKRLPNGRNDGGGRYVRLDHYLLKTAAWQNLDATARAIYIELKFRYNGSNNGRIRFGIREAAASLRIGKSTAARALAALKQNGFIIAGIEGKFDRKSRHSSEWLLTEYPADTDIDIPHLGIKIRAYDPARKDFARPSPANNSQQTVPVVGLTGPVVGPIGPRSGTVTAKKAAHGI